MESTVCPTRKPGVGNGQPSVVIAVTSIDKEVHGPQDETDGVHDHTANQGWLVPVQVNVSDEAEDDTGPTCSTSDHALKMGTKQYILPGRAHQRPLPRHKAQTPRLRRQWQ